MSLSASASHPRDDDAAESRRSIGRRRLLQLSGGALGASTLGIPTGTTGAFAASSSVEPVSMAMHIHGSFSEGSASMDAHLFQANRLGVDVVWWTDHDFRASAFGYRTSVGFDGEHEPDGPWDWTWVPEATGVAGAGHDFVAWPHSPGEQGGALRINATASSSNAWATYMMRATAGNLTYSTSYSDTTLQLDVRPEQVGTDAEIVVEVSSSYRPARQGRPAGRYRLQYRIGTSYVGHHLEDNGLLGVIGVKAGQRDAWQQVTMDLRSDHAKLWPDTFAGDASLVKLKIGARTRNSATATVVVDRLRFLRTRRNSADGLRLLHHAMDFYRDRYPTVAQYAAAEVSLVMHLNSFGGDHVRPDYTTKHAVLDNSVEAQRRMVDFLHAHGSVVSLNHPLKGSQGPNDLASRLITTKAVGADVIEVGTTSDVSTLERVFDIASRNAVFLTANGSTDDHGGVDWLGSGRRWLTSVWSPSRRQSDLGNALKAGRAWFYDPLHWRGALDLLVDGTTSMGGVLFTPRRQVSVEVKATHLPAGSALELVVGRCDRAGAGHLHAFNSRRSVAASRVVRGRWATDITRGNGVYVRAMVRSSSGQTIGFSNPVWVLPHHLVDQVHVPAARRQLSPLG